LSRASNKQQRNQIYCKFSIGELEGNRPIGSGIIIKYVQVKWSGKI
jgi:hypothetical protein